MYGRCSECIISVLSPSAVIDCEVDEAHGLGHILCFVDFFLGVG